jgi:hypothetical protein
VKTVYARQEMPEGHNADASEYLRKLSLRRPDASVDKPLRERTEQYTDLRWQLYSLLLADIDREWTAIALADRLAVEPSDGSMPMSVRAVSDAVHVLMGDSWVEPVPFQALLTVRLTTVGAKSMRGLLDDWGDRRGQVTGDGNGVP